jgi:hypothetical protein
MSFGPSNTQELYQENIKLKQMIEQLSAFPETMMG